ncbi:MAG: translation initiation factor IF-2, partial [Candidatus Methylomirabilis sp.]|nr:translation initiation factor IF-2 [Deltaproteobacteria bacterium]
ATHFHVVPPSGSVEPTVYIPATEDDEEARRRRLMKKKTGTRPFDRREGLFGDRRGKTKRGGSKKASKTEITVPKAIKRKIRIEDTITVQDLAKGMSVKVGDLIRKLMGMGVMATANQALDVDTATILAGEFEYEVENVALAEETYIEKSADKAEDLRSRPPVVTVMGHVDHGKTLLLDAIRRTNVVSGEAGGITQHIGAYKVNAGGSEVVFLDTPGHEAFSAMRARGANVTDLVVLVVAANDGVMPQTVEAINHAKAAGAPIIVAVNKIDLPEANPDRVERGLMEHGLVPERLGGETAVVHVSAKSGKNIESLLEMIHLQADVLELKANPDKPARGRVIEAKIEKGRGPVATVLVREGTLKVGDPFVCGVQYGRVRAMQDENGRRIESAGPSTPVEILGMPGVPEAGDEFSAVATEKDARTLGEHRALKAREAELRASSKVKLEDIFTQMQAGEKLNLGVIVKADVQGSVEAVAEALRKLSTDKVELKVIHAAAGGITESDVNLAASANAIVIGFHVRPEPKVAALAEREKVEIRLYQIIYDAVDDVKSAMEGMLAPTIKEVFLGRAQVRDTFSIPRIGVIAGSYVTDGKIERNSRVRLIRDSVQIYEGKLGSLRRFKDDVREVAQGYECGIGLENFNDVKVGDVIESFTTEEVKTEL